MTAGDDAWDAAMRWGHLPLAGESYRGDEPKQVPSVRTP